MFRVNWRRTEMIQGTKYAVLAASLAVAAAFGGTTVLA